MNEINSASAHFNVNWDRYQDSVNKNMLYHCEMFAALNDFITSNFSARPFSLADIGCGDSRSIAPVLLDKPIKKYIGVDAAPNVLKLAESSLAPLQCEKEFICDDMTNVISHLTPPIDIILSSYAVHHLSTQKKFDFIYTCKDKLATNGFFIMIDIVMQPNQTRETWLTTLQTRMKTANPALTDDELEFRMLHPRASDYPEYIRMFEEIAKKQGWARFQVLMEKEIFAFMVFAK